MIYGIETLSGDISTLALTIEDISNSALVAVGYCSKELLPPYPNRPHRKRALEILDFVNRKQRIISIPGSSMEPIYDPVVFGGSKVVQVVGGYASLCVPSAVEVIISNGLFAYVNSRLIFGMQPKDDASLQKFVLEGITPYQGRKVLPLNDTESIYLQNRF